MGLKFFKGTVPRDFSLQVFHESISPKPRSTGIRLEFFFKLVKIFAAQGAPPVSLTLVANGENLQRF
jgi:hypothetical protein